jgi:hypothetical protein
MSQATLNADGKFDLTTRIIEFETGEATEEQVIELFQYLVDTGLAWSLQGSYGRIAQNWIENGLIRKPNEKNS